MKRGYTYQREKMVEKQLRRRGIEDERVNQVFLAIKRHVFVEESLWDRSYDESPLPIGKNQTISQPYIVALMTQALELRGDERVLEIGTGSGYQTAILASLAQKVFTVERHVELVQKARAVFESLSIHNIAIRIGDGTIGWKDFAPYHGIIVTAAAPKLPQPLFDQLIDGGKVVIPIGGEQKQILYVYTKTGDNFEQKELCPCAFVPLIGIEGWKNKQ